MADYYPLIARAVTGLDKNSGEARRALYERARTALVTQLRGVEPALSEADITRERLALEDAIRKVEAEAARRPRQESPESPLADAVPPLPRFERPAPSPPPPPPPEDRFSETPPPSDWRELQRELDGLASPAQPETSRSFQHEADAPEPTADEPPLPFDMESPREPDRLPKAESWPPAPPRRSDKRASGERPSLVDEDLKGFREVVAQTDDLGGASASASKTARQTREAFSALPPSGGTDRIEPAMLEPSFGPEDLMPSEQDFPSPRREPLAARGRAAPSHPAPDEFEDLDEPRLRSRRGGVLGKIMVVVALLVLAGAAFFAYREWGGSLSGMFQTARAPTTQTSKDAPQPRPEISDRIGGAQQDSARPTTGGAAVAQRAILYEQGASPQERKQYVGSVIWRTEKASPGPGQPPDIAVRAEVEIPERQMRMGFTVRRNLDQSMPASHTIEILFSTPADFPPGGIADVQGVVMEDSERGGGAPLSGMRVKVTNGFFLIGLTSVETVMRRNVQLLKERPWFQMRLAYSNGRSALLAIEKGVPGDRAFEEALNAWGQYPPPQ